MKRPSVSRLTLSFLLCFVFWGCSTSSYARSHVAKAITGQNNPAHNNQPQTTTAVNYTNGISDRYLQVENFFASNYQINELVTDNDTKKTMTLIANKPIDFNFTLKVSAWSKMLNLRLVIMSANHQIVQERYWPNFSPSSQIYNFNISNDSNMTLQSGEYTAEMQTNYEGAYYVLSSITLKVIASNFGENGKVYYSSGQPEDCGCEKQVLKETKRNKTSNKKSKPVQSAKLTRASYIAENTSAKADELKKPTEEKTEKGKEVPPTNQAQDQIAKIADLKKSLNEKIEAAKKEEAHFSEQIKVVGEKIAKGKDLPESKLARLNRDLKRKEGYLSQISAYDNEFSKRWDTLDEIEDDFKDRSSWRALIDDEFINRINQQIKEITALLNDTPLAQKPVIIKKERRKRK